MTSAAPDRLTQKQYAELRGYSQPYVSKLKKQQRLVLDADGRVLVAQTDAVIAALRDPSRGGDRTGKRRPADAHVPASPAASVPPAQAPSYNDAARREKEERTKLLQMEIAEKAGQLVRRDQVEAEAFRLARQAQEAFMAMPDRMGPILAAETDVAKVQDLLAAEVRRIVGDLVAATGGVREGREAA